MAKKICIACARGFYNECQRGGKCKKKSNPVAEAPQAPLSFVEEYKKRGKVAKDLSDPKSTGRKRAAELYPLNASAPCEWQGKKNCGGGRYPVIGCVAGTQKHRHHGPVKDTTRNQAGNVHRICHSCHNHWHELNDLTYDQREYGLLPHDPEEATVEELVWYELDWRSGKMGQKFKLASSVNKGVKFNE